jgi:tetratricopeptide (TPR) repeat protein
VDEVLEWGTWAYPDLAIDTAVAVERQLKGMTKSEVVARISEIEEAPLRRTYEESRKLQAAGDLRGALAKADEAIRVAEAAGKPLLVGELRVFRAQVLDALTNDLLARARSDEAQRALDAFLELRRGAPAARAAEVAAVRGALVEKCLQWLREAVRDEGKAAEARAMMATLEPIAPEREVEMKSLRAGAEVSLKQKSAKLVKEAGALPVLSYQTAERLLREATELDPGNAEARELLKKVLEKRTKLEPTYMTNLDVSKDGDGLKIQFGLANRDGELVAAEGRVTVYLALMGGGEVHKRLYARTHDVTLEKFRRQGLLALGYRAPRVPYGEIAHPFMWEGSVASYGGPGEVGRLLRENHPMEVRVIVDFVPTGVSQAIRGSEDVNSFVFR